MGMTSSPHHSAWGTPPPGDLAQAVIQGTITGLGAGPRFSFFGPFNVTLWANVNTSLTVVAGSLAAVVGSGVGLAAGDAVNSVLVPPGTTIATIAGTAVTLAISPYHLTADINDNDALARNIDVTGGPGSGTPPLSSLLGATVSDLRGWIVPGTTVTAIDIVAIVPGLPNYNNPGKVGVITLSAQPIPPYPLNDQLNFSRTGNAIPVSGVDALATFTGSTILPSGTINLEKSFDGGSTWIVQAVLGAATVTEYLNEPERGVLYRLNCTVYSAPVQFRLSQTGAAAMSVSQPAAI